ncbi:MAG: ROK family transcriptional regulator [Pyrinomonadaceae bacterium]|nr:ROK family transcriptional regulator [Pyrinomonadaceae bacterium]
MAKRINLSKINVARSSTIRDINRRIILNYVREEGPISRAEIARSTDLQRSTVSLIVDELTHAGLVQEVFGESSGGRPPRLLSLKSGVAIALGVQVGIKRTIVGRSDLSGKLIEHREFATNRNYSKSLEKIVKTCKEFIKASGNTVEGIGLSLPGLVESWDGKALRIPRLNWDHPKMVEDISGPTGLPVKVENDANAVALAEVWHGRPEIRSLRNFIVVLIDNGIGTGVVFDGQIYRGKRGVAGEFGHMRIGSDAPSVCSAGNDDCWEAFASERAALARYRSYVKDNNGQSDIDFPGLVKLALEDDPNAVKALKETAHYIGIGISNLIQGLSPEVTIVTGTIVGAWSLVSDEIQKAAENAICNKYPPVTIMPSTLGEYPSLMGALSLVLVDKFASVS